MKYLSFDIEATGLEEDAYIIEFGMVPFCTETLSIEKSLSKHFYVKCPSFESLENDLSDWVKKHNKELIQTAHSKGITLATFKKELEMYLMSAPIQKYFNNEKVVLFGKSISAIDLPFLNRDLGWEWMNHHFSHRNLDLTCLSHGLVDMGILPPGMESGSALMNHLEMGEVCHTALEDAINTAEMYLKILKAHSKKHQ
ncbi:MAG: hypothetical protein CME62_03710 [Halobacteriovoraceae bacterium]|nr:hypothetical protein [Halobacteriovoraceae bacterium]|tara:strand:- start:8554 stop:9147 length:594 start_codon:yes stop_codon:yes gene_type:complete